MKTDWVPFSAALLLTGALALALGSLLIPSSDGGTDTMRIVEDQGGQWMAAAAIYLVASVFLTLGLPTTLVLLQGRGRTLGLVSAVVLEFGFIGTAGYAMLMVFFRALVRTHTIVGQAIDDVAQDAGLRVFLVAWIAGFVLGELLLGLALLRARTVPRWVPLVLILHVVAVVVSTLLPDPVGKATILLFVAGMAGIAITATAAPPNQRWSY
ncbi:hypothetical protein GON03_09320 [Nocardioides sp. MAH-18]|uniref:DUF4386 family protein n=1 Tax=Nocardioides agri TaxID=2682843 RepID=A0A6L6XPX5_9ACTN|nr:MULTISPECIES: hypothetical protein [unclassified Nocardioides]MBA2954520.1 hypothetical protein [Nocardioides sp. CGMCC 1.13656]MVQ49381.1 hypothetical protein [Nocardioides sp. MAH-18]